MGYYVIQQFAQSNGGHSNPYWESGQFSQQPGHTSLSNSRRLFEPAAGAKGKTLQPLRNTDLLPWPQVPASVVFLSALLMTKARKWHGDYVRFRSSGEARLTEASIPAEYRYFANPLCREFLLRRVYDSTSTSYGTAARTEGITALRNWGSLLQGHTAVPCHRERDLHPPPPAFLGNVPDAIIQKFFSPLSWVCSPVSTVTIPSLSDGGFHCGLLLFGLSCNKGKSTAQLPAIGVAWCDLLGLIQSLRWLFSITAYGGSPATQSYKQGLADSPLLGTLTAILDQLSDDTSIYTQSHRRAWEAATGLQRNHFVYNFTLELNRLLHMLHRPSWVLDPSQRSCMLLAGLHRTHDASALSRFDVLMNVHIPQHAEDTLMPDSRRFSSRRITSVVTAMTTWSTTVQQHLNNNMYYTMAGPPVGFISGPESFGAWPLLAAQRPLSKVSPKPLTLGTTPRRRGAPLLFPFSNGPTKQPLLTAPMLLLFGAVVPNRFLRYLRRPNVFHLLQRVFFVLTTGWPVVVVVAKRKEAPRTPKDVATPTSACRMPIRRILNSMRELFFRSTSNEV